MPKVLSRSTGVVKSIDVLVLWSNRSALFDNCYELAITQFQNFTLNSSNSDKISKVELARRVNF